MNTLHELRTQAEKIHKQIGDLTARDRSKVLAEMVANMDAYGISFRDLQIAAKKPSKASKPSKSAGAGTNPGKSASKNKGKLELKPKYRGPDGELWSGRGVMPKWIRTLIAGGRSREDFLIEAANKS